MNDALIQAYKQERAKRPHDTATQCLMGARHLLDPKRRRYFDKHKYVCHVAGIGELTFTTEDDPDYHDEDPCAEVSTIRSADEVSKHVVVGTRLNDGSYYLGCIDRDYWKVRFDDDSDVLALRAYWQAQGCSKSDAEVRARANIQKQCIYHVEQLRYGDRACGVKVVLTTTDGEERDESVWGVSYNGDDIDIEYCLDLANDFADELCSTYYQEIQKKSLDGRIERRYHDAINLVLEEA